MNDNKVFYLENYRCKNKNKSDKDDWFDEDLDNRNSDLDKSAIYCNTENFSSNYIIKNSFKYYEEINLYQSNT